jgi:hypothetical protein
MSLWPTTKIERINRVAWLCGVTTAVKQSQADFLLPITLSD